MRYLFFETVMSFRLLQITTFSNLTNNVPLIVKILLISLNYKQAIPNKRLAIL